MIRPFIEDFTAHDHFAQPLGFLQLATHLKRSGFQVEYLDCLKSAAVDSNPRSVAENPCSAYESREIRKPPLFKDIPRFYKRYGMTPECLRHRLLEMQRPACVLVTTGMTYWYSAVRATVSVILDCWPAVPVALGGVYCSLCPDHAAAMFPDVRVFPGPVSEEFFRWIESETGTRAPAWTNPADTHAAWELVDPLRYVAFRSTVGCSHGCSYCAAGRLSGGFRARILSSIHSELRTLTGCYSIRHAAIYDDDFGGTDRDHFRGFLELLVDLNPGITWHLPNAINVDVIEPDIARLLRMAGFAQPRLSINHMDRLLDRGGWSAAALKKFKSAAERLRSAGYHSETVSAYIVAGLPNQSLRMLNHACDQLLSLGIRPYLSQYSPIPGTGRGDQRLDQLDFSTTGDLILTSKVLSVYRHPGWTADEYNGFASRLKTLRHGTPSR